MRDEDDVRLWEAYKGAMAMFKEAEERHAALGRDRRNRSRPGERSARNLTLDLIGDDGSGSSERC